MTTVVLLRHGRTSANSQGILAGRSSGVGLDETGQRQAAEAAARLAAAPVAAVVSSPLLRCRRTAAAVADRLGLGVETNPGLVECDYGDWTGRKLAELTTEPLWPAVQSHPSSVRFPSGESMVDMSSRAVRTVRDLNASVAADHGSDAVWVAVSHGDVIKAIVADALGMHLDDFQRVLIDPGSISVIRYTPERPYVACLNTVDGDLSALLTVPTATAEPVGAALGGGLGARNN